MRDKEIQQEQNISPALPVVGKDGAASKPGQSPSGSPFLPNTGSKSVNIASSPHVFRIPHAASVTVSAISTI